MIGNYNEDGRPTAGELMSQVRVREQRIAGLCKSLRGRCGMHLWMGTVKSAQ